jgi:hypothetical protein
LNPKNNASKEEASFLENLKKVCIENPSLVKPIINGLTFLGVKIKTTKPDFNVLISSKKATNSPIIANKFILIRKMNIIYINIADFSIFDNRSNKYHNILI